MLKCFFIGRSNLFSYPQYRFDLSTAILVCFLSTRVSHQHAGYRSREKETMAPFVSLLATNLSNAFDHHLSAFGAIIWNSKAQGHASKNGPQTVRFSERSHLKAIYYSWISEILWAVATKHNISVFHFVLPFFVPQDLAGSDTQSIFTSRNRWKRRRKNRSRTIWNCGPKSSWEFQSIVRMRPRR